MMARSSSSRRPRVRAALAVGIVLTALGGAQAAMLDPTTVVRTGWSNDALACPAGACVAQPDLTTPTFPTSPERLLTAWRSVVAAEPRTRIVAEDGAGLVVEQRSRFMGFVDTIAIRVLPTEGGVTFAAYSRANLGWWDLGVNRARLDRWIAAVQRVVGGT